MGFDFLKRCNILIDPCNNALTFPDTYLDTSSMINERTSFKHMVNERTSRHKT